MKHPELVTKGHLVSVIGRCERAIVADLVCPLCGLSSTIATLEKHLGLHLQEVALFVLPCPGNDSGEMGSVRVDNSRESTDKSLRSKSSFNSDSDQQTFLPAANEEIQCICSYQHDDGFLIECNKCNKWQHGVCMGISEGNVPELYECSICIPDAHHLDIETAINTQEGFRESYQKEQEETERREKESEGREGGGVREEKEREEKEGKVCLELLSISFFRPLPQF